MRWQALLISWIEFGWLAELGDFLRRQEDNLFLYLTDLNLIVTTNNYGPTRIWFGDLIVCKVVQSNHQVNFTIDKLFRLENNNWRFFKATLTLSQKRLSETCYFYELIECTPNSESSSFQLEYWITISKCRILRVK